MNRENIISEKELTYFSYSFKDASCLGKIYLSLIIYKQLYSVPGSPVISNCGTPNEKVSEFLDHHLQLVMKSGKSYVKDTGDFLENIKSLGRIPEDAFLVTTDVVGLHLSIPHDVGVKALYKTLEEISDKKVSSADLADMIEFVFKSNFFEFDSKAKPPLGPTLHHHMHVSSWRKLRLIFWKRKL